MNANLLTPRPPSPSARFWTRGNAIVFGLAVLLPDASRAATSPLPVRVSATRLGRTPAVIGYNMGENLPGSNVTSWLRYSELNGARFWWAQEAWPALPNAWPAGAANLARFEAERARLRAEPLAGTDRPTHAAAIAQTYGGTPPDTIGDCHSLSELRKLGAEVLIMMSHRSSRYPFDRPDGSPDWFGRWSLWRGVYLNAYYLAQHYGTARFQLFNEPDHPNSLPLTQSDYLRRLQIESDAVQAAVADINRRFGRSLAVQVSAPVSAGLLVFQARSGRPDTRDATTGWGELLLRHRHDDFPGRSDPAWPLLHTYAFQNYGRDPGRIATGLPELRGLITAANGGTPLPILVSEMNVSTAANFSKTKDTLDTPSYYAAFGAVAAAYVNAGIDEIYVFRLTQNAYSGAGGVKKNGTHFIREADPLKNILGNTKGAEAVRLLIQGFKGGRERLAPAAVADQDVHSAAAHDETTGAYTLMIANLKLPRTLALDLSAWQLPSAALAVVAEVSEAHHGDVRSAGALPARGPLLLAMAPDSVALVSVWPRQLGEPRITAGERSSDQSWQLPVSPAESGRALLAVRATAKSSRRVRLYGGAGEPKRADLLGQLTLQPHSTEALVDVTRYLQNLAGRPATFHFIADDERADRDAFTVEPVALRRFGEAR